MIPARRCWCIKRLQQRRQRSWSFIETARPSLLEWGLRLGDTKTLTSPPHSAHCPIPFGFALVAFENRKPLPSNLFFRLKFLLVFGISCSAFSALTQNLPIIDSNFSAEWLLASSLLSGLWRRWPNLLYTLPKPNYYFILAYCYYRFFFSCSSISFFDFTVLVRFLRKDM